ncbi:MAG: 4Fe-4S dicluster domain-containing protein [Candidatus Thermoplasmatota archaeon]|nr:4Fe-4S dicluster domain-containing protein [Candidatus Thermoplasmatota archaeon]MDI6856254.1 4Fe-4S dicluster domain-containing protein [Candidatus Thermoplasmatota archaeon]
MKTLVPYPDKCTGCRYCELICSLVKENLINLERARVKVLKKNIAVDVPIVCTHCGACIDSCPTEAIYKKGDIVLIDKDKCVGCGECVETCPLGVIVWDKNELADKCDLCNDDPQCVKFCTEGALKFEEINEKQFERMRSLIK